MPVFFGSETDPQAKEFLEQPTAVEKFKQRTSNRSNRSGDQTSPLVKQAKQFSLYLDPPEPQRQQNRQDRTARRPQPTVDVRPQTSSATFTLVGTSYYPDKPEKSLALIDQAGRGLRWVRQSETVGRHVFEQIKDGVVVVKEGQRTVELTPKFDERPSNIKARLLEPGEKPTSNKPSMLERLLKGEKPSSVKSGSESESPRTPQQVTRKQPQTRQTRPEQHTVLDPRERQRNEVIGDYMQKMKKAPQSSQDKSGKSRAELMEELVQKLRGSRVNKQEADGLENLGQRLREAEQRNRSGSDREDRSSRDEGE
jgi:hypothetical protein